MQAARQAAAASLQAVLAQPAATMDLGRLASAASEAREAGVAASAIQAAEQQLEQERWKQTLEAMESAAQGKVVDASEVHSWLNSWGTENEQDAPRSGK